MDFQTVYNKYQRQIHLDFHTSPRIHDVGVDFDAREFAQTMKQAHVNSVTVFAKCHHGMCYYPTQTGVAHPAIGSRDLLGEQIEALHREGIRAPIYTTVVWEENVAQRFPEWRQMRKDGKFAEWPVGPDGKPGHVGTWKFNNFLDPRYQDYFESHLREVLSHYGSEVDGFFIDILFYEDSAGWSDASVAFRQKHNLMTDDVATFHRFQGLAQVSFAEKFTKIIHGVRPEATVFYNAQNDGNMHPMVGPRARGDWQTHFEIESLPSGFWGYFHFPRMARAQSRWGKPWMGMTGRFQKMWGDFGGIKPVAALEFECFRAQALGGANSVGDQLPPRGTLDPAAYDLIGTVFGQVEQAEPFYEGASLVPAPIGIFSGSYPGHDGGTSEEGAVLLCEEAHYDCAMLDSYSDLSGFEVLMLPDSTAVSAEVVAKIKTFYDNGGQLILSHKSGRDESGKWMLDFLPLEFAGEVEKYPSFWRARASFDEGMSASDRVFYEGGLEVKGSGGTEILVDRVLPYFRRTALTFSSHFQTPPQSDACEFPAVIKGERFVYFADPIFFEYRKAGNLAVRQVWNRVMQNLVGAPLAGDGLSARIIVYPMRKGDDLLLTLLHYIPVRKAMDIDVIDEPSSYAGEVLRLAKSVETVRVFGGDALARQADGGFELPATKGRLLLEVPGYFAG